MILIQSLKYWLSPTAIFLLSGFTIFVTAFDIYAVDCQLGFDSHAVVACFVLEVVLEDLFCHRGEEGFDVESVFG